MEWVWETLPDLAEVCIELTEMSSPGKGADVLVSNSGCGALSCQMPQTHSSALLQCLACGVNHQYSCRLHSTKPSSNAKGKMLSSTPSWAKTCWTQRPP